MKAKIRIDEQLIFKGSFNVPHYFLEDGRFGRAERLLLIALFKIEAQYAEQAKAWDGWFLATNETLARLTRLSEKTLRAARFTLLKKGCLIYRRGHRKCATKYKLHFDKFYLIDRLAGKETDY